MFFNQYYKVCTSTSLYLFSRNRLVWLKLDYIASRMAEVPEAKNNHDAFTRHGYCIAIQFYFVRSYFICICSLISPGFHLCRHHSGISL